jgi:hypothetical protein
VLTFLGFALTSSAQHLLAANDKRQTENLPLPMGSWIPSLLYVHLKLRAMCFLVFMRVTM